LPPYSSPADGQRPREAAPRTAAGGALLYWCRRLRIRWEMRDEIHEAFLSLAAALICWRRLTC